MAYLDLAGFRGLTVAPSNVVDDIEAASAGWIDVQLAYWSKWIDARLLKRYQAPFASPYPVAVQGWLSRIVTLRCYLRRGVDPTDPQFAEIKGDAEKAEAEIKEAADAKEGLFELPLRADVDANGVTRGGPMAYSETSPYVWTDRQRSVATDEDRNKRGTGD